ncbi:MAG: class IV adenylate cyclase [Planctomycetota bacterium]
MTERRNLEIKLRCEDLVAARARAMVFGARDAGVLLQRDTFFGAPRGRLKLREMPEKSELIFYERPDIAGTRLSRFRLVPVPDATALREALAASMGIRGEVKKRRELLLWKNVRIHLDEVEDLGRFVEFEAVLSDDDIAGAQADLDRLAGAMGIDGNLAIPGAYADLLGF